MILSDGSLSFPDLGHFMSSPSLEGVSRPPSLLYRTFLSERNGFDPMDWPPIGSSPSPGSGGVRQDRDEDIGFRVSDIPPVPL